MFVYPKKAASCLAVCPLLSKMVVDAPFASRATTMAGRLFPAAMCRGVNPLLSLAFIFLYKRNLLANHSFYIKKILMKFKRCIIHTYLYIHYLRFQITGISIYLKKITYVAGLARRATTAGK